VRIVQGGYVRPAYLPLRQSFAPSSTSYLLNSISMSRNYDGEDDDYQGQGQGGSSSLVDELEKEFSSLGSGGQGPAIASSLLSVATSSGHLPQQAQGLVAGLESMLSKSQSTQQGQSSTGSTQQAAMRTQGGHSAAPPSYSQGGIPLPIPSPQRAEIAGQSTGGYDEDDPSYGQTTDATQGQSQYGGKQQSQYGRNQGGSYGDDDTTSAPPQHHHQGQHGHGGQQGQSQYGSNTGSTDPYGQSSTYDDQGTSQYDVSTQGL
jgi:hypothetical protein